MTNSPDHRHPSRRAVLRGLAQATALAGGGLAASRAFGQDAALEALIDQNQSNDFGQGFDSGSRTIQMPKASLPTLSPATVQHTEQAIAQFEASSPRAAGRRWRKPTACGSAAATRR